MPSRKVASPAISSNLTGSLNESIQFLYPSKQVFYLGLYICIFIYIFMYIYIYTEYTYLGEIIQFHQLRSVTNPAAKAPSLSSISNSWVIASKAAPVTIKAQSILSWQSTNSPMDHVEVVKARFQEKLRRNCEMAGEDGNENIGTPG